MQLCLSANVAFIPIAEGFGDWYALAVQANVVHSPAVDSDRAHAFRRELDTLPQTFFYSLDDLSSGQ